MKKLILSMSVALSVFLVSCMAPTAYAIDAHLYILPESSRIDFTGVKTPTTYVVTASNMPTDMELLGLDSPLIINGAAPIASNAITVYAKEVRLLKFKGSTYIDYKVFKNVDKQVSI